MVGDRERIHFWEDLWQGNQPLCSQFPHLYKAITTKNLTISGILGNSYSPLSWKIDFNCNLTDLELRILKDLCPHLLLCTCLQLPSTRA